MAGGGEAGVEKCSFLLDTLNLANYRVFFFLPNRILIKLFEIVGVHLFILY